MTKICFSRGRCEWHKPNHNSKIIHKISFLARSLQQDICETYIVLLGKISTFLCGKFAKRFLVSITKTCMYVLSIVL